MLGDLLVQWTQALPLTLDQFNVPKVLLVHIADPLAIDLLKLVPVFVRVLFEWHLLEFLVELGDSAHLLLIEHLSVLDLVHDLSEVLLV